MNTVEVPIKWLERLVDLGKKLEMSPSLYSDQVSGYIESATAFIPEKEKTQNGNVPRT